MTCFRPQVGSGADGQGVAVVDGGKGRSDQICKAVMVHITGGGDYDPFRMIEALEIISDGL